MLADEISTLFTGDSYVTLSASSPSGQKVENPIEVISSDGDDSQGTSKSGLATPVISPGAAESPDPHCRRWIPLDVQYPGCPSHPLFQVQQLGVDRRLIVNRKRQLKMYRVWIQAKFQKTI
jgi:tRNAThr (cytosine32-N3)-methyltransferase